MTTGDLGEVLGWLWGPGRRRRWRRTVLRRALAMACALVAAIGTLTVARAPRGGPAVTVVVATRALGAGAELTAGSVRQARWPTALVPDGALRSVAAATGQRLTSPLGGGEVLTRSRLSGSGVLQGQAAGTLAVHVALGDSGAVSMVRPGDTVDLVGPNGVVARAVRVLLADAGSPAAGTLMGAGSTSSANDAGVVVGVDEADAIEIARVPPDAMGRPALTLVLRSS